MDVKRRREEYAELTRDAILEAATERFSADGFAGTTVDAVAEAARVTKGAVYHHFKDKAELLEATFVRMEEQLVSSVVAAVEGVADPWDEFARGVDAFLEACLEPRFRRIALEEAPVALGWARWKKIEEDYFLGMMVASLDALAADDLIRIPPGDLTARMVLAAVSEAGLALSVAEDPDAERARAHTLVMRLVAGLR